MPLSSELHFERSLSADPCQLPTEEKWFGDKASRLQLAATWASSRVAAGLQNVRGNLCRDGFAILIYHRVAEHVPGVAAPTLNVTPGQFRRQMAGLLARGFDPWPLSKLLESRRQARAIPSNVFAVTFDDGYENNYTHALPILRELRIPATIFLATQYLDTNRPFPFDDWSTAGSSRVPSVAWRPLSTRQCSELLADGLVELGAHTHSHRRFVGRRDEFRRDLSICLDFLRNRFDIERPTFAFPYGDMSPELIETARQLGVACCLSTRHRRVLPSDDGFPWGRFDVDADDSPGVLAAKVSGWYSAVAGAVKAAAAPIDTLGRLTFSLPAVVSSEKVDFGDCRAVEAPVRP